MTQYHLFKTGASVTRGIAQHSSECWCNTSRPDFRHVEDFTYIWIPSDAESLMEYRPEKNKPIKSLDGRLWR